MSRISNALAILPLVLMVAACGGSGEDSNDAAVEVAPIDRSAEQQPMASAVGKRPAAFARCAACHSVDPGKNLVGPSLAGAFGAKAGHVEGFNYSPAMKGSGLIWDEPTLNAYLEAPMKVVPGTRMTFAGLSDPTQRREVIEYLESLH